MKSELTVMDKRTPIEIMLEIDDKGMTTVKKLYDFLELDKSNYARWIRENILENEFAAENEDYIRFVLHDEMPTGGKVEREDYKITASFAKKLAMRSHTIRGEQARNYFIMVEDKLKSLWKKELRMKLGELLNVRLE